ncbi:phosphotransferase [Cryobacterium sp. BB307]|uniref:phosphotransferase enzyme family protein n=1 Tax=Cryobacterium sp. BB307 TaxID=2716317 RepID=UPI001444B6D4|nr:phosphotransferase [Cryobacterium sp. BB307]
MNSRKEPAGAEESLEVALVGGGTTGVTRVGDTVRRPAGSWTPAVHKLLAHLASAGFTGAPLAHGLDELGREILDFVPGEVGHYPIPESLRGEKALVTAGALLRNYHDATVGLVADGAHDLADLQLEPQPPIEVVCHGDFAPYNVVFRDGAAVAIIDFDFARLGPRAWDLAYALYRFAPLSSSLDPSDPLSSVEVQAVRARVFLDAYGCTPNQRSSTIARLVPRLEALIALMRTRAGAGDENFARHIADGHLALYLRDIDYIRSNEQHWRVVVDEPPSRSAEEDGKLWSLGESNP